jgi:hypothetical protein
VPASLDRTGDLFDTKAARDQFEQGLRAAGCLSSGHLVFLMDGPFSAAAQVTHQALADEPLAKLPPAERRIGVGTHTLAREFAAIGLAIHQADEAGEHAQNDWPELLAFVADRWTERASNVDHDGPALVVTHIVEPCETLFQPWQPAEARDGAYAALRHLASHFPGHGGFRLGWRIEVECGEPRRHTGSAG